MDVFWDGLGYWKGVSKKNNTHLNSKTSGWMKWYVGLEIVKFSEDSSSNLSPCSWDDSSKNTKRSEELSWYHREAHDQHFPFIWSDYYCERSPKPECWRSQLQSWTSQIFIDSWYTTLEKKLNYLKKHVTKPAKKKTTHGHWKAASKPKEKCA